MVASYLFYASGNWRFAPLLLCSTVISYFSTQGMLSRPDLKKLFLLLCVGADLGVLGFFKYLRPLLPLAPNSFLVHIGLPLGISFYTFQSLSYSIDVFKGRIKPERNWINYALFIAFFPQLIAGPIERATSMLPKIGLKKRIQDVRWREAIYLFVYGMFKKRVLGDHLDVFVGQVFDDGHFHGGAAALGIIAYTAEAFCNISGYTDMARGLALGLGIELGLNFRSPFFAANPADFWTRWHISLSEWMRLYVFTPLLVRSRSPSFAILLSFLLIGIWYGPQLHYLCFGAYWGAAIILYHQGKRFLPAAVAPFFRPHWVGQLLTTTLVIIGLSLFRASSLSTWFKLMTSLFQGPDAAILLEPKYLKIYACLLFSFAYEWLLYRTDELVLIRQSYYAQATFFVVLFFLYRNISGVADVDFIYFQF